MQVFISYSANDTETVTKIATAISLVADTKYWNKDKNPGDDAWESIFSWIDSSNVVLAIITDSAVSRGMCVGQEIGRAIAKGKRVIPLVGPDVKSSDLGCISGITYERINPSNPMSAVNKVIDSIKGDKEAEELAKKLLVIFGIIIAVSILSK